MTLSADSLEWAIEFVADHSDGDIFPKILEIKAIQESSAGFVMLIEGKPLTNFVPGASRRFIVPKDEISYRQATQLDPQDSILLSAVIYQFGQGIEDRRLPADKVFSYGFHRQRNKAYMEIQLRGMISGPQSILQVNLAILSCIAT